MELLLKKKKDPNDHDPLVIHVLHGENDSKKFIAKVGINQTIEVDDELGYKIMAQYSGCFEQRHKKVEYETRTMKAKET